MSILRTMRRSIALSFRSGTYSEPVGRDGSTLSTLFCPMMLIQYPLSKNERQQRFDTRHTDSAVCRFLMRLAMPEMYSVDKVVQASFLGEQITKIAKIRDDRDR
jgi:hypothetical protein